MSDYTYAYYLTFFQAYQNTLQKRITTSDKPELCRQLVLIKMIIRHLQAKYQPPSIEKQVIDYLCTLRKKLQHNLVMDEDDNEDYKKGILTQITLISKMVVQLTH